MNVTLYSLAKRFLGLREAKGAVDNPLVLAMLQLDSAWPQHDEVPWCSAFVNWCCWLLELPRSKSLAARSWLPVGTGITLGQAEVGFDIVVLDRPGGGPAAGHVGIFAGRDTGTVLLLAGNQGDRVSIAPFPEARVLSVRRLADA